MESEAIIKRVAENWAAVETAVAGAISQAGRQRSDLRIIGVTKYVDAATTAALVSAGCDQLGENRPQVLWEKAESGLIGEGVQWHIIGHLQRNKVRRTLKYRPIIHSIDSPRLLESVAEESKLAGITTKVMLEVNISGEENKTGMDRETLAKLVDQIAAREESSPLGHIELIGLMAMAGWGTDADAARSQFAKVRTLRDGLATSSGLALSELSMGMSGDYEAAIAEGATMVRIGSRLFEGVRE